MNARRRDGTEGAADGHAAFVERDPARMPLHTLVPWTGAALTRYQQRAAAAHGITPTALAVLGALIRRQAQSHRDLAGRLGVTPATLTPVVDALEEAGDVRRERDGTDRRIVRLIVTDAGERRWLAASARVAADVQAGLPTLSPADEATVRRYLVAVLGAVTEH